MFSIAELIVVQWLLESVTFPQHGDQCLLSNCSSTSPSACGARQSFFAGGGCVNPVSLKDSGTSFSHSLPIEARGLI